MADPLTLGLAGHIDHGKTTLVEALTGTRTDRLPEEQRRGMSIELGFAELELPGQALSVVDVPGHNRLVRRMIAGASGISLFLMAIAADDGVMPQTREHAIVLDALGVRDGVVALTKCDAVAPAAVERAARQARELLPEAPVVAVSSRTGEGLGALRAALAEVAGRVDAQRGRERRERRAVLHLDRVFTIAGHGTVATGTLWSGTIEPGAQLMLLPGRRAVRVRTVEVHGRRVARAHALQRAALNLAGVRREEVASGDVVADPLAPVFATYRLDVALLGAARALDAPVRLQAHLGTRNVAARLVPLGAGWAQLRLEAPLLAAAGDRLVLRRLAPPEAIGGAEVLDAAPRRHGPGPGVRRLRLLAEGGPAELLAAALAETAAIPASGDRFAEVPLLAAAEHRFPPERWRSALDALVSSGLAARQGAELVRSATPARQAVPQVAPPSPLAGAVLAAIRRAGAMPPAPATLAAELRVDERAVLDALRALARTGALVRLGQSVYFEREQLAGTTARVTELLAERGSLTIAELRDALQISRKYAQALLEHFDAVRLTRRAGDAHVLRRPAGARR